MAYVQLTNYVPQWHASDNTLASGQVIKAYLAGTSTGTNLFTDSSGTSAGTSIALNARGEPEVSGNTVIPYLDDAIIYKLSLYPTQAAADADSGAIWTVDNINPASLTSSFKMISQYGDSLATAITDIGATETTLWIDKSISVTADATVPSNITLKFLHGGNLNVSATKTVTNYGDIDSGHYQIIKGAGQLVIPAGAKLGQFDVMWYGVTMDGSTNDAPQLQKAINTNAGRLLFPAGDCSLASSVTAVSNQLWIGQGRIVVAEFAGSQAIDATGTLTDFFIDGLSLKWDSTTAPLEFIDFNGSTDCGVINCLIEGDTAVTALDTLIEAGASTNFTCTDNTFKNLNVNIVRVPSATGGTIDRNKFNGPHKTRTVNPFPGRAIIVGSSSDMSISNNRFDGGGSVSATYDGVAAIDIGGVTNSTITGNLIKGYDNGINLETSGGNTNENVSITGNVLVGLSSTDASYTGFGVWLSAGDAEGVCITGNVIKEWQIPIKQKSNAIVANNIIDGCYESGIESLAITNVNITGNSIINYNKGGGAQDAAINVELKSSGSPTGGVIAGNHIFSAGGGTVSIFLDMINDAGDTHDTVVVNGNVSDKKFSFDMEALKSDGNNRSKHICLSGNRPGITGDMQAGYPPKLTSGTATPDVTGHEIIKTGAAGTYTITDLLGGVIGQKLTILFADVSGKTQFDFTGTNLKGNNGSDLLAAAITADDSLVCTCIDGTKWVCDFMDNTV